MDTADVVNFVATATKTSTAGFTDSATAVDVLTTAINSYKLEGTEAERVASMLVKTQDEGKTSVGELAANIGRVIPSAAAYNVSLENLTTAYALLTKGGMNTAISTTNLGAMLDELAKSGSNVAGILEDQTGKSFAELMGSGSNLGDIMTILSESVDGDATAFSNLWSITFGAPTEQTSGQIIARNSQAAAFHRPSTTWGTWTYSALYSAETSGEPVYIKPLTESVELKRGYMPTIAEGAVEVGIN